MWLTALRGPDSDRPGQKYGTTAVIRHAIGLRSYIAGAIVEPDSVENTRLRLTYFPIAINERGDLKLKYWEHFSFHAKRAFDVLGLAWDKLNPKEKL